MDKDIKYHEEHETDVEVEKFSIESSNKKLTIACKFFSYFSYKYGIDNYISIPIPNDDAHKIVLEEIVPYFKKVMKVTTKGKVSHYNMIGIKTETENLLKECEKSGDLFSILPDLYRGDYSPPTERDFINADIRQYSIDIHQINLLNVHGIQRLLEFLNVTFFKEEEVIRIQPIGWVLTNNLRESMAIRSLSKIASRIDIVVNRSNDKILSIEVFK